MPVNIYTRRQISVWISKVRKRCPSAVWHAPRTLLDHYLSATRGVLDPTVP